MAKCVTSSVDKQIETKEIKRMKELIFEIYDDYNRNDLLRFLMTGSGKAKSRGKQDFITWAEMTLGSNWEFINLADAEYLNAQYKKLKNATSRNTFEDPASMRAQLMKYGTLPADMFNSVGLKPIYTKFSEADANKELAISKMNEDINQLRSRLETVSRISISKSEKKIAKATEDVAVALSKMNKMSSENKKTPGKYSAAELREANLAHTRAQEALNDLMFGDNRDPGANLIGLIVKRLDGQISKEELLARTKDLGGDNVLSIVKSAEEFVKGFQGVAKEATRNMREVIYEDLVPIFGREEARAVADKIINFEVAETLTPEGEPTYYPHRNLVALFKRVDNVIKIKSDLANGDIDSIRSMAEKFKAGATTKRKASKSDYDMNLLSVLTEYGREMHEHAHAARIAREATSFMRELTSISSIKKGIDNKNVVSEEVAYARSVRRLLNMYSAQILDRKASTFVDEAMGVATAFQVLTKLSNPSTVITNRLEGVLQYMSYYGLHRVQRLKQLRKDYSGHIDSAMKKAQIDFSGSDIIEGGLNFNSRSALARSLTSKDMADFDSVMKDIAVRNASKVRRNMSKAASFALKALGWEANENKNRRESFELGAAEAAEYVVNTWEPRFNSENFGGRQMDYIVRNFNLDKADYAKAKAGDKDAKLRLWGDFKDKYIIRQGLRGMFDTQVQYSRSARNVMDLNSGTKWITLFQHYPRAIASTLGWAMADVKNLYNVGGLKGLGRTVSSKEGFLANHSMQHVLTVGLVAAMRQAMRMSTGIVLFNILNYPGIEMLANLYDYFTDDNEFTKKKKAESMRSGFDQPVRMITGPMVGETLDVLSLLAINNGIKDGTIPEWLNETLHGAGMRLSEEALTENGRKKYSSAFDIVREHMLWDSFAVKDKAVNVTKAVMSGNPGNVGTEALKAIGIRFDWEVVKKKRAKTKGDETA